eukprot:CAMPEP_0168315626 /NCGR_PEP_ID=MMETSP0210-20121227/12039_1 /TAXON_ID=40633 /ORGANISM="Condylostoma magnum, Strain COL2" /LENGTH=54 /DNA_ID=CAMNT_0008290191 /DNA_START=355 /DNA_END=517 /DNA_ORIENTATION=+
MKGRIDLIQTESKGDLFEVEKKAKVEYVDEESEDDSESIEEYEPMSDDEMDLDE